MDLFIGVIYDGKGFGLDGAVGGEFFAGKEAKNFKSVFNHKGIMQVDFDNFLPVYLLYLTQKARPPKSYKTPYLNS